MEFLKGLWNTFKFGASCLLGPSLAITIAALFGTAYLLAESTNIVEAKVKHNIFGGKEVGFSPFFKSISDGLRGVLVDAWTDYCAYAPIQAAKIVFEKTGREVDFTTLKETREALKETKVEVVAPSAMAAAITIPAAAEASKDNKDIVATPINNNAAVPLDSDTKTPPPSTVIAQPVKVESFLDPTKTVDSASITKMNDSSGIRTA